MCAIKGCGIERGHIDGVRGKCEANCGGRKGIVKMIDEYKY